MLQVQMLRASRGYAEMYSSLHLGGCSRFGFVVGSRFVIVFVACLHGDVFGLGFLSRLEYVSKLIFRKLERMAMESTDEELSLFRTFGRLVDLNEFHRILA